MATYNDYSDVINSILKNKHFGYLNSLLMYGFLNPLGKHYQGSLFLEEFLESVGLKEWFDGKYANMYLCDDNILIDNNHKHIIINDIFLADEENIHIKLEEYCEEFEGDFDDCLEKYENLAILYLAPHKKTFSKESLGEWEIQGDYFVNGDNKVRFKTITYKEEILKWIEKSQTKVGCITHLNAALLFYKNITQITTDTDENTKDIEKLLADDNLEENIKIISEILNIKEKLIDSYCEEIVEKYKEQIESKGFEIAKVNNDLVNYTYPFIIKPKDCGEYYFAFCIEEFEYNYEYVNYGVRLFKQDSDYIDNFMISRIHFYLGNTNVDRVLIEDYEDDEKGWWWGHPTKTELESKLQEFLDSNKIKEFNDKLKSIQAYCDTMHEIRKTIENNYKDYVMKVEEDNEDMELEDSNQISIWHKDFNDEQLYFMIDISEPVGYQNVCFNISLGGSLLKCNIAIPILKEVLGVDDDSAFRVGALRIYYKAQHDEINPKDLTKESFINYFESVREQVYNFNQKIKDDLAKGQDSKLRKCFLVTILKDYK